MTFDSEDIQKYQQLNKDYFNEEIDSATAIEEMNSLMFLVSLIYHPQLKQRLKEESEIDTGQKGKLEQSSK
ncbi:MULTISPECIES: hypothetical protein [Kitasatospora]|uniref:hypothetical protein n=1 Tax=Kitasatospora TaxID=2063 RepID=UPI0005256062|nr:MULTISPECIES: hypothetical protein [Kitasatospora]